MPSRSLVIDEDLALELPLPLSLLFLDAVDARSPIVLHQSAYFLWEAALKFQAIAGLACLDQITVPAEELNSILKKLSAPGVGDWWNIVKTLLPLLAEANVEGFPHAHDFLLNKSGRSDLRAVTGLFANLESWSSGQMKNPTKVVISKLFDRLTNYRNVVIGHGAVGLADDEFYLRQGKALLEGIGELLSHWLPLCGRTLVNVIEFNRHKSGGWIVEWDNLTGPRPRSRKPLMLKLADVMNIKSNELPVPNSLYLLPSASAPSLMGIKPLRPLAMFLPDEVDVALLNAAGTGEWSQTHYLAYASCKQFKQTELAEEQRLFLSHLAHRPIAEQEFSSWVEDSVMRLPSSSSVPIPEPPRAQLAPPQANVKRVGGYEAINEPAQGGIGVVSGSVDALRDEFNAQWCSERRPDISTFLARVNISQQTALLRELISLDVEFRRQQGESPSRGDYGRFAIGQSSMVLDDLFPPDQGIESEAELLPAPPEECEPVSQNKVQLEVIDGPHQGQKFEFDRHDTFVVGRSNVRLQSSKEDMLLSRNHFLIEVNPPLCRIIDLKSRNGTTVNKKRISAKELENDDLIQAGMTFIRVSFEQGIEETGEDRYLPVNAKAEAASSGPIPLQLDSNWHSPSTPASFNKSINKSISSPTVIPDNNLNVSSNSFASELTAPLPQLAGYRTIGIIGRGRMGAAYQAISNSDGNRVAIKVISPKTVTSKSELSHFIREVSVLKKIAHSNIVRYRDFQLYQGAIFVVMDYVAGSTASEIMRQSRQPLTVERAVTLIVQLLDALSYVHAQGDVHRDVKPSNLLISKFNQEELFLANVGLSRIYQSSKFSGLAMTDDFEGSMAFMPPEQITNYDQVDPASDQYSTAATLYFLLTKHYIYDLPEDVAGQLLMVLQGSTIPISDRRTDLPTPLVEVIHKALSRDPADRFPDMNSFQEALLSAI